ncbi:MAG: ATP-binding cassette domain-containing protein [Hyphomicrobiales bacterium]|nr:ATP-binding cassette domain-containing protein [Hyphomicrobiales bacterium]
MTVLYFRHGLFGQIEPFIKRWLESGKRAMQLAPSRQMPPAKALLQLDALDLRAGSVEILNDLSRTIERPGIYCMIGPNGAGKTTTFNAITGELRAHSGTIRVFGDDLSKPDPRLLTKSGLGRKFQIPNVFENLTIGENIAIALWTGRAGWRDLIRLAPLDWTSPVLQELVRRFEFLGERNRTVGDLSHGQRQVLDLAMVLCTEPRLILLDEPCAGLSLAETEQVIETIRWATDLFNATTLVIEHDMALVQTLADHVFVLHNGHLLAEGTVEDIQCNAAVQSVYAEGTK